MVSPPPIVTGLSPNEGPPGTKVTIRGEQFGQKSTDLIGLKICGCDCLLSAEWKTPNKIIAITGPIKGKGEVVVTTRLGGQGTCSVSFKGYYESIGPMKESAVWVEEAPLFTWGRNTLSPISYQQDDPLGLSTEGNEKKIPEDDLLDFFPDAGGDITSNNFSAGWFLLENHHATSFSDLRAGLSYLRRKVEGQKEGQLSFLKANVSSVMDQIDTIVTLKEKYSSDMSAYGSEPTLKLEKAIKESEREARKLFDDVLARRDKAEQRQNALNVLNRFRLLFCLPCVIEQNIQKADFEIVINDYIRVKNLFSKSEVPIFKTALDEIEKRIHGLKQMLHAKLVTMPRTVDEQKRIIKYLISLEADCDPAWDAIKSHHEYINLRMQHCYEEHKKSEEALAEEYGKSKDSNSKYYKYNPFPQDVNVVPENVLFIEELCTVISLLFPDLWKIGQAYFTEELHVKVGQGRQLEFKALVLAIMQTFSHRLYAAIIPHLLLGEQMQPPLNVTGCGGTWILPDADVLKLWLPACLRYVRATYTALIKLDLPGEALDIIATLILDLRIYCVGVLFRRTGEQVKQLVGGSGNGGESSWTIEFTGESNGITQLPLEFERLVHEVIQIVKDSVFTSEPRETSLLQNSKATRELDRQIETLLLTVHTVLSQLAAKTERDELLDVECLAVSQLLGTTSSTSSTMKMTSSPLNNEHGGGNHHPLPPVWEHRLLTTLSNCQYTRLTVLPRLSAVFRRCVRSVGDRAFAVCGTRLETLERALLEHYLEEKCDPLVGTIEPSMYLERFDWDTALAPTDIRPYAKECINNLIHVHSEVNSISPALVRNVLPQVVQTVSEELFRLMSCVQCEFSLAGKQQAHLDILALQTCFTSYLSPKAKTFFQEALDALPPIEATEMILVDEVLKKSFERMRLQMLCLS